MADVEDARSEGSGGPDVDDGAGLDADFGAIEMFDSNAAPLAFSSQVPEAVMTEDTDIHSSSRKSRRDKKDKKRRSSQEDTALEMSRLEADDDLAKKHRKSKRKSTKGVEVPDSQPQNVGSDLNTDTPWGQLQMEAAAASSQTKKKRKLSDSIEGKRRKKHRSKDQEPEDQTDGEGAHQPHEAGATSFLRKGKDQRSASENAIYEDHEAGSDPQASPTVAHLRRRSQSKEARSRENSVPASAQMDVDVASGQGVAIMAAETDHEAERIAREAWIEHRNGQATQEDGQNENQDTEMPDQYPQEPLNTIPNATVEAQSTSPQQKRQRSTRKKAKPTYFERPSPEILDDDDNRNALAEMPSPSAMTPKPRNRTKRAAKKESRGRKPKREKLSQSMRGGSVDEDEQDQGVGERRNRLSGYTQGRFSDAELARISRAVETFRENNGLTQQEVNELIHAPGGTTAGETNAQLWVRIFAECPDRHRQKVINITRKKFHNFVARGTWTPEQDAELAELIHAHGTKWSLIAGLINRHPEDLRDRYRNYIVCGANQRKDAWDEHEEARLTQYIMESMHAIDELRTHQPSRALLQKSYEELIDWQDISERMDRTRSRLQCITKWKSLNIRTHGRDRLISTQPDSSISFRLEKARRQIAVMPSEERYRLVMAIQAAAVGTDVKIPWQRLVDKPFRNKWHRYTQMLLWRRLRATVPNHAEASVRDVAHVLMEHYNQTGDLPEISDELFDDADEMDFIQTVTPMTSSNMAQSDNREEISAEFVTGSDMEDGNAVQNGNVEVVTAEDEKNPPQHEEMKIDPALVEVAQTTNKSTPAKRGGKTPGSRKRGRKSAVTEVDPIEDVMQAPEEVHDHDSEIDVEQLRKKKTPSKFQSPGHKRNDHQSVPADDESVMDDMEDLPAKVAAWT